MKPTTKKPLFFLGILLVGMLIGFVVAYETVLNGATLHGQVKKISCAKLYEYGSGGSAGALVTDIVVDVEQGGDYSTPRYIIYNEGSHGIYWLWNYSGTNGITLKISSPYPSFGILNTWTFLESKEPSVGFVFNISVDKDVPVGTYVISINIYSKPA